VKSYLPGLPPGIDEAIDRQVDASTNLAIAWITMASSLPSEVVATAATIVLGLDLCRIPPAGHAERLEAYTAAIRRAAAAIRLGANHEAS